MSKMKVQCKGSGKQLTVGFAKRGVCPVCHRTQDLTGAGKVRRHDRILSKRRVKHLA